MILGPPQKRLSTLIYSLCRNAFAPVRQRSTKLRRYPRHQNRLPCKSFHVSVHPTLTQTSYSQDIQFFPPELVELQEREMAVHKRLNGISAVARDPQGPEDTPEKLEEERLILQDFIDTQVCHLQFVKTVWLKKNMTGEPLDDDDLERKKQYIRQGFHEWSRRDFQQLVRDLETYEWYVSSISE